MVDIVHCEYDRKMESEKWIQKLPYLAFKPNWLVKVIPPIVGAVIRFWIKEVDSNDGDHVSIYFDAYNNLGYFEGPYWELYPASDGDTARFSLGDEDELLAEIEKALKYVKDRGSNE